MYEQYTMYFQRVIDFLKVDVEYSEWEAFDTALKDGSFTKVKQLAFELHTHGAAHTSTMVEKFKEYYGILKRLEDVGFRRWTVHNNQLWIYQSKRTGKRESCCFEMSYVNIHFARL